MIKRLLVILFVLAVCIGGSHLVAQAQAQGPAVTPLPFPLPLDFGGFLTWIASGGGAGVVLSYLLELLPFFTNIPSPEVKQWIIGLLAAVIGYLAQSLLTYLPNVVTGFNPWWQVVLAVLTAGGVVVGAAVFHAYRKRNGLLPKYGKG